MKFIATLLISFLSFMHFAHSADPTQTVEQATSAVISELKKIPAEERNSNEVQRLVESYILPAIDQQRIAKLALGKHWRKATKEQRIAFIETFRDLQVRTYTGAFKAFDGQKFEFEAARFNKSGSKSIVKGHMIQPNGQRIPIDFKLYVNKQQDWKIYDAVIAGLGMVRTYRQQLSQELQSKSLDDIIANMAGEVQTAQR
ncbi:MAG: ABC transporter substrate-binding protein [Oleispira antarctica]|uniref:Toluene tolerance family protein n=1 Tax=Oleispira antarctica RB-8 TaxID=698738 RepID=R4YQZ9_OLEAN|nr:ABC transporter substrate-binding protein [Oleispira antarctica]MBQ0792266.1 ABC transporter substrate-binding protein [Oleispira antarctica]CCK74519.1 Toluene tolerance family protein [Oleispira antarctica RB-8]